LRESVRGWGQNRRAREREWERKKEKKMGVYRTTKLRVPAILPYA
jgi:ribosomal protein L37E